MNDLTRNDQRAIVAELLGTMFFVMLGTGAVVSAAMAAKDGAAFITAVAIAHGIAILTAVAWTANISGGHINPAVTLAMLVTRNIKPVLGVAYIVAQLAGAALGSLLLKLAIPNDLEDQTNLGLHSISGLMSSGEALLLEALMTAFLVVVVFNVAVSKKGWGANAPIAVGLAVMLIHFVGIPFTGASVNPARSFGPALVTNEWADFWIYVAGPAIGAVAVAAFWMFWKSFGEDELEVAK
ncbi:MAG: MIP family channel protein [Chloroflexi bacterium]|nr:MIP family channel protein [Chloroflexota bacterium]